MTTQNRTALLTKIHKVLKKHYTPAVPRGEQPVLESLLLACCLENTHSHTAEKVFGTLKTAFIDWNEIRVSTVKELSEAMHSLADPASAAARVKGILQSVFESEYSFDLETLKKTKIGDAVKRLQKLEGSDPYIVAFANQAALGGHAIPIDKGTMGALAVLGVVSESEAASGTVPGMERAISKNKGQEFAALLHELGADFIASPFSPSLKDLLLSIAPDAKDRLPKRSVKKAPEPESHPSEEGKKKPAEKPHAEKPHAAKPHPAAPEKAPAKAAASDKTAVKKKEAPPAKKLAEPPHKADHKSAAKPLKKSPANAKKKGPMKPLAKRKPR